MKTREIVRLFTLGALVWAQGQKVSGQTWSLTTAPTNSWKAIACSVDGSFVLAASSGGSMYSSSDSGATWVSNSLPSVGWQTVAVSPDGHRYYALGNGFIYSSGNSGATWVSNAAPGSLSSLAVSSDGTKAYAARWSSSVLLYSTNSMASWTPANLPTEQWLATACTPDGNMVIAAADSGPVYISTNAGVSWSATSLPIEPWASVSWSPDGERLIAAAFFANIGGVVYTSTNSGMNWRSNNLPVKNWTGAAMSVDGKTMVVCSTLSASSPVYASTNGGSTWAPTPVPNPSDNNWWSVAMSADGGRMFGLVRPRGIYTSFTAQRPQLNLTSLSENQVKLSWTVPSIDLVLQQNSTLDASWTNVAEPAVLDSVSVEHQTFITATNDSNFYRLATP